MAPHQASFEEATPAIRSTLQAQGLDVTLTRKASDLIAKTKEMGGDLGKAAKSMGLEVKDISTDFDRAGAVEGVGSASVVTDAFTKPVGAVFGPHLRARESRDRESHCPNGRQHGPASCLHRLHPR